MTVKLLGVPYDAHSSFLRGPALAPSAIRAALTCGSANWCSESGLDLDPEVICDWIDIGDVDVPDAGPDAVEAIRVLDGDRYSHACPFARIMEAGKVSRLIQFGIRTMNPHQREQADRFGVEVHEFRDWDGSVSPLSGPVYVTIDLDALDPAFAPGVSHHEPGGLSTRQLLDAIRQIGASDAVVVGADVVELNPTRDVNDVTAMVAAKLVRELLGLLIESAS